MKYIRAGRLVRECIYTASFPSDSAKTRAEKQRFSSAARQRMNDKTSWEKLKMTLAATFDTKDIVVTMGYDDEHLPRTRAEARVCVKKFLSELRKERREYGKDLVYVYNIEQFHGAGRFHHMLVINGTGADYAAIRKLWTAGTDIDFAPIDEYGYEELAKYMTKEAREFGRAHVGERTWVCSRNVKRPEISPTQWVSGDVKLEPPVNAHVLRRESLQNEWGSFFYLEYLLPRAPSGRRHRPKAKIE